MSALRIGLVLAMLIEASAAWAGLRWDDCESAGGRRNKSFACDGNRGTRSLVLTVFPDTDITDITQIEVIIRLDVGHAPFPDWWLIADLPSACRQGALQLAYDFDDPPFEDGLCEDPWRSLSRPTTQSFMSSGGSASYPYVNLAILITCAPGEPLVLRGGREQYLARLIIDSRRTIGTNACAGCDRGVCLTLDHLLGIRSNGDPVDLKTYGESLGWQGAIDAADVGCSGPTAPAK